MSRIAVSPGYRERHVADYAELDARAEALDVFVSTEWRNRLHAHQALWRVRVRQGERFVTLEGRGELTAVIAGALDDFVAA